MRRAALRRGYTAFALFLTNALLALLLLNLAAAVVLDWRKEDLHPGVAPPLKQYGDVIEQVYPGRERAEIEALLGEIWGRPYVYEPFTQFRERSVRGRFANVDPRGFRRTRGQGPWPPAEGFPTVFVFGGSTTFGYGVGDEETLASFLQVFLSERLGRTVRVYNFGRGHYYSSQERILFERLLVRGHVPDAAVFVDGLNEFVNFTDEPLYTPRLAQIVEMVFGEGRDPRSPLFALSHLPAVRLLREELEWEDDGKEARTKRLPRTRAGRARVAERVVDVYLGNKRLVEAAAAAFEVPVTLVWQPVPVYRFGQSAYPFDPPHEPWMRMLSQHGYPRMAALADSGGLGPDFLWLADLHASADASTPLYVDRVHYSPAMARLLARHIGQRLLDAGHLQP